MRIVIHSADFTVGQYITALKFPQQRPPYNNAIDVDNGKPVIKVTIKTPTSVNVYEIASNIASTGSNQLQMLYGGGTTRFTQDTIPIYTCQYDGYIYVGCLITSNYVFVFESSETNVVAGGYLEMPSDRTRITFMNATVNNANIAMQYAPWGSTSVTVPPNILNAFPTKTFLVLAFVGTGIYPCYINANAVASKSALPSGANLTLSGNTLTLTNTSSVPLGLVCFTV